MLGRSEIEGKPGSDSGVEPGIDGNHRGGVISLLLAAVHPQGQLEHQQLLVHKPAVGCRDHFGAARTMDLPQGLIDRQEILLGECLWRQGLGDDRRSMPQRRLHGQSHVRLLHTLRQRIDREPLRGVGLLVGREPADLRMGKLPALPPAPRLAGDHHPHPLHKPLRHERHVEPDRLEPAAAGFDRDCQHRPTVKRGAGGDGGDQTGYRGMLDFDEVADRMRPREVLVVAREMHQGVADGYKSEPDQAFGPGRAHPRQPLEPRGQTRLGGGRRSLHEA